MQRIELTGGSLQAAKKILIIDNEQDLRNIIEKILLTRGAQVLVADDHAQGITLLSQEKFDFVLADLSIPTLSKLEKISELYHLGQHKVVLMTGFDSLCTHKSTAIQQAATILYKPFPIRDLFAALGL